MGLAAMLIPAALSFVPAHAAEATLSKGQPHPSNWIRESRTVCVEGIFGVGGDGLRVVCAGDAAVALAAGRGRGVVVLVAQARVCAPRPVSAVCWRRCRRRCDLQTMKGLPSMTLAEPVKIASLSYGLSFHIDTGRCAQCLRTSSPVSRAAKAARASDVHKVARDHVPNVGAVAGRDADVVLVHEVVHAVHLVVERDCAQQRFSEHGFRGSAAEHPRLRRRL